MVDKISDNIVFDEDRHKYYLEGKELNSVSRVLGLFKNKFDPYGHIVRAVAKRDGLTVSQVQKKWEKERDDSCERGHKLHSELEHFVKTGEILDGDYNKVVENFANIKFHGKLFSEVRLYSPSFEIAGTTDLVELLDDNIINIGDYKQNKALNTYSKYKNKLLYPLHQYDECEFEIYTFQMNMYSLMLEEHGYKTNKMTLYYIPPGEHEIQIFDVEKREEETRALLNHYRGVNDIEIDEDLDLFV